MFQNVCYFIEVLELEKKRFILKSKDMFVKMYIG